MAAKFGLFDHRVHDTLMKANRERGMTPYELAKAAHLLILLLFGSIDRLKDRGFVEMRWQGERWPNGDASSDVGLPIGRTVQLYRTTSRAKQTLAARIESNRES